ncbi:CHL4 family chromosome segregation protein [Cladophialophora carrionii]|uniref:CHL4 family chromosome segregation protein n=1 Tax=Cladophialophora carrionii TaxID=86049 RepID=A0A1C1CI40_9EURO|nr:CHL4 family chromosome segregation protein [Cladophialophora carrionii]
MAPILAKSLNRLSREAIIELGLKWLEERCLSSAPYLQCNRTGFEADEEDYLYTPAESIKELRTLYHDLRQHPSQTTKRDVIDRIIDGDWRRGLSLHQHATIDFAYLEQNDAALKWSALKLVPLKSEGEKPVDNDDRDDGQQPAKKKRRLDSGLVEQTYPHVSPEVFLSALKTEISPLVKAHYHVHRMPSPYSLTVLRLWIQPNSAFAPRRSKVPRRPKQATDAGRIMYIALPDSCPYVYISISGSATSSTGRSKGSVRGAKEKVMAKVDMAALKRIVLEAIPKALSRPHQRWALESTNLVAKSLKTMCELRGNQKPGTSGGAYSIFTDSNKAVDNSPVDVHMTAGESELQDDRQGVIEKRFGHTEGEHYAPLDRVHVKLTNPVPPDELGDEDASSSTEDHAKCEITLTFTGSNVFGGLKKLAELGPTYVDLEKMPAWMTGELGVSNLTV